MRWRLRPGPVAALLTLLPALAVAQQQPSAGQQPQQPAGPRSLLQQRQPAIPGQPTPPAPPAPPRLSVPAQPVAPRPAAPPVQAPPPSVAVPPGAAGAPPAVFYPGQVPGQRPKAPPRIGDELHDTRWRAETIQGRPVLKGAAPTLEFLRDDYLRGGTGCNRYVGPWHTRVNRAVMGPLSKSRMSCRPELDQQERLYLDTLDKTERIELKDEKQVMLIHSSASKQPSRFVRLP